MSTHSSILDKFGDPYSKVTPEPQQDRGVIFVRSDDAEVTVDIDDKPVRLMVKVPMQLGPIQVHWGRQRMMDADGNAMEEE